jgi:outer membrane protein TolC
MPNFPCYAVVISVGVAISLSYGDASTAQTLDASPVQPTPTALQPPASLNLDSNLLQLPTQPAEVQLQSTQAITLQQAIALAERNNRELQVAELTLKRSQAGLRQARAALYPTLNGEAELAYERNAKDRLNDLKYEDKDAQSTGALGGTVELSYDLFTSGRRPAQIRAAEQQVQFAQLEVDRVRLQTRLEITNAYYDLQQADEQIRITQAGVKNVQRLLSDAQALEEGGLGTKFDIVRTRVQLGNAEQELIDAQVQQEITRRQLVSLLSLSEVADVSAADPVEVAGDWKLSLEDSILLAYKNRVEFQQQLAQREIAQQQRRVAIAGYLPQVSLFANYQVVNEFNEPFGTLQGYAVGGRLRWNLFDGGAALAVADQETQNRAIAETRFAQQRNQIRLQVEQAYKNLKANSRSIETAAAALKEAREALDIAQFRFQSGVGTQLDVITAQTDLIRAESNRLRAVLNHNRALAALQRATSNPPATPTTKNP